MNPEPTITAAACEYLAGRPLVVRGSPRHGCCGGHALVPIPEVGPPEHPDRYRRSTGGPVDVYLDVRLTTPPEAWTVDAVGIGRWRRLHLDGMSEADPATEVRHRHS